MRAHKGKAGRAHQTRLNTAAWIAALIPKRSHHTWQRSIAGLEKPLRGIATSATHPCTDPKPSSPKTGDVSAQFLNGLDQSGITLRAQSPTWKSHASESQARVVYARQVRTGKKMCQVQLQDCPLPQHTRAKLWDATKRGARLRLHAIAGKVTPFAPPPIDRASSPWSAPAALCNNASLQKFTRLHFRR